MVTGVFLFVEISYMLLLSYPIKYFFKQQILSVFITIEQPKLIRNIRV